MRNIRLEMTTSCAFVRKTFNEFVFIHRKFVHINCYKMLIATILCDIGVNQQKLLENRNINNWKRYKIKARVSHWWNVTTVSFIHHSKFITEKRKLIKICNSRFESLILTIFRITFACECSIIIALSDSIISF